MDTAIVGTTGVDIHLITTTGECHSTILGISPTDTLTDITTLGTTVGTTVTTVGTTKSLVRVQV